MIFIDCETRSRANLPEVGIDIYTQVHEVVLVTYAIDQGPVEVWHPLHDPMPQELHEALASHYLVAFNSRFDRLALAELLGHPPLEQWLDVAAQAYAAGLRGGLDMVSKALKLPQKPTTGARAMKAIADASEPMPAFDSDTWARFVEYALHDTRAVRSIWSAAPPMSAEQWADFHVSERINDRGLAVDLELARACASLREVALAENNAELQRLTGVERVTMSQRIACWVRDELLRQDAGHLVSIIEPADGRLSLDGKRVLPRLREECLELARLDGVVELLDLLEHGRSNVAVKFEKIAAQAVAGRLHGSFVFNGAGQTGRYSSRGVQLHNLTRASLDNEEEVIEAVLAGRDADELRELSGVPLNTMLARLLRPTIIAPEDRWLQWGDWSAIEARVLPWLSGHGERVLEVFERGADLYVETAKWMGLESRQAAKVAVLALGFGGSVGAYRAMSRGYGVKVTDEEALDIVRRWRDANPWARSFWYRLGDAAKWLCTAGQGKRVEVGRVALEHNGRMLMMWLPSGRALFYPDAQVRTYEDEDGEKRTALMFRRGGGWWKLWHGMLAENATQAVAADLLRGLLRRVQDWCVGHTHDEVLLEVPEPVDLLPLMVQGETWSEGLPLAAEVTHDTYYHK